MHITTVPDSLDFFRGQLDYMKERGFSVQAITSPSQDLARLAAEFCIPISPVAMARQITPLADAAAVTTMRRLLCRYRPAIVHTHTPKGGLLGLLAALLSGTPVRIYHLRGLRLSSETGWRRHLLRLTEWLSCRLAHQVLCVSDSLRAVALHEGLCRPSKIKVLGGGSGNGVDAVGRFNPDAIPTEARREIRSRFGLEAGTLLVAFVGRVVRDKGIDDLVRAWRQLGMNGRAHLLLIGAFEDHDPLPDETRQMIQTDPTIHAVGLIGDMPRWYAAVDLVVLPSHREGFPNVLLEAAAMRLPVVATKVPGCVDAVEDATTGTLVPVRDPQALARAIRVYLTRPELRQQHGEAARSRVLVRFRPEAIWQALYDEYVNLLQRAGLPVEESASSQV